MQMRLTSVSGTANARQDLPTPHAITRLYLQGSRLQMHVIRELATTYVERDCIARHCFQRNWHCRVERVTVSRDIIRKAISRSDDAAVSNRQHCFPVGVIGADVTRIARK